MKTTFLISLITIFTLGLFSLTVSAQKFPADQVPSVVKDAFNSKYPTATNVRWAKKDSAYEIFFTVEKDKWDYFAKCTDKGKWLQIDHEVYYSELPEPVKKTVTEQFAGYKPEKLTRFETIGKPVYYQLFLVKDTVSYIIECSTEGVVLRDGGKKISKPKQ